MNHFNDNIDHKILYRLRKGDELAFEIIFHRYKKRVKGFIHKMVPPNISSDIIVQDVFLKIWLNRDKIDPEKNFSAFIITISKNLVLDALKSAVNRKLVCTENIVLEDLCASSEFSSEEELEKLIQILINKLPVRRRQIFNLSRFEGLSYKQIAAKLNITENTVDTQIRKSLQFLRKELRSIT